MNIKDVEYIGIFLQHINGNLNKDIPNQHITLVYQPNMEKYMALLHHLGKGVEISVLAYGNDGKNEGLLVEIPKNIPYFGAEQKHITLSIDPTSSAVKTGYLDFSLPIPEDIASQLPDTMVGHIAIFTKQRTLVYDASEFSEFTQFESEIADDVLNNDTISPTTNDISEPSKSIKEPEPVSL